MSKKGRKSKPPNKAEPHQTEIDRVAQIICEAVRTASHAGTTENDLFSYLKEKLPDIMDGQRDETVFATALRILVNKGRIRKESGRLYIKEKAARKQNEKPPIEHIYRNPQFVTVVTENGTTVTYKGFPKATIILGALLLTILVLTLGKIT